jgi:hypothetical protein
MTATCKFCGSQAVKWAMAAEKWTLLNEDTEMQHRCPEYELAKPRRPGIAPKKNKQKTGAFLRFYGPRTGRTHAQLVETGLPDPDTPAGMYLRFEAEPREPMYTHLFRKD